MREAAELVKARLRGIDSDIEYVRTMDMRDQNVHQELSRLNRTKLVWSWILERVEKP